MDPGTGSFMVNIAQAAVIAAPWFFRAQLLGFVRSARRRLPLGQRDAASCEHPMTPVRDTTGDDVTRT
jgi:hypothetical protein